MITTDQLADRIEIEQAALERAIHESNSHIMQAEQTLTDGREHLAAYIKLAGEEIAGRRASIKTLEALAFVSAVDDKEATA